tara:strand:- start:179 stop:400 length:222 start_codon:yes stop_codon:yes gene_type:complete
MTRNFGHLRVVTPGKPQTIPLARGERGFRATFHPGQQNRCPACNQRNWYIGRSTAECAFCETAVPIAPTGALS